VAYLLSVRLRTRKVTRVLSKIGNDQREVLGKLQPVFEVDRETIDRRGLPLRRQQAVIAAEGIDQRNLVERKIRRSGPRKIQVIEFERRHETIFESEQVGIPRQMPVVANGPLNATGAGDAPS
jgi:hypothetical protein